VVGGGGKRAVRVGRVMGSSWRGLSHLLWHEQQRSACIVGDRATAPASSARALARDSRSAHSPCSRSEVKDVCARAVPPPKRLELGCTAVVGIVSSLVELAKLCFTLCLALLPVDVRSLDGPSAGSGVLHPRARGMTSPVSLNSHRSVPLLLGCSLGCCALSVKRLFLFREKGEWCAWSGSGWRANDSID
jgi:hypothetical protein